MKTKHVSVLATIVVASLGANSARGIQKHDPIFQPVRYAHSQDNDPDMIKALKNQSGSPRSRPDLYVAHPMFHVVDPDYVREIRYQNGSPKSKGIQKVQPAPVK
jgi:hypothetical protein